MRRFEDMDIVTRSRYFDYLGQISLVSRIPKKKDYYDILKLERNCSLTDVEKAYEKIRRMVRGTKYHAAHDEALRLVEEAFYCLSDKDRRKKYNQENKKRYDEENCLNNFPTSDHTQSIWFHLFIHLPMVLLCFGLIYSVWTAEDFSTYQQYPYTYKLTTANGVDFYVKSADFDTEYPPTTESRLKIEHIVESRYNSSLPYSERKKAGFIGGAQASQQLDVEKLLEEVLKCDGFDRLLLADVFDYFVENEKQAKAFIAKPDDLKKYWIESFSWRTNRREETCKAPKSITKIDSQERTLREENEE